MPVLRNISQLAACPANGPQQDAGLLAEAAVAWSGDTISWVGPNDELPAEFSEHPAIDCQGQLVIPGLIDCHTHLCFGGWRGDEFESRLGGATYQEIAAAGGGIASTVSATRAASENELLLKAGSALDAMLELGVTTVECKSGYGLDAANELKQLEVYRLLDRSHRVDLVPTFLGAHVMPPEFRDDREAYIRLLCEELIPAVASEGLAVFCDAFVEDGAYSRDEAGRIFDSAARHGHLEYISPEGIEALADSGTVAVSLPLASLYLNEPFIPARKLLSAGVPVAVATDFNPGSAPSYHLPLAMTLACLKQAMTPQEALNGATTVAARAISAETRIGSLAPGYQADLAIIDMPSLNQWLYNFVPNACVAAVKKGRFAGADLFANN
jgi:imidazolonepropionase